MENLQEKENEKSGKLFVVPTPIGNLKDITLRALEVLKQVEIVICEDTRRTSILLRHYQVGKKKLISYYAPKEKEKLPYLLSLLKEKEGALVSDAGMPALSDPGEKLIQACLHQGIPVEVLPGPSSVLVALVGSGLSTTPFLFGGFVPKKKKRRFFRFLFSLSQVTVVFFESPHRLWDSLKVLYEEVGDLTIVIGRELTKMHEEWFRGSLEEFLEHWQGKKVKGEVVVVARKETSAEGNS